MSSSLRHVVDPCSILFISTISKINYLTQDFGLRSIHKMTRPEVRTCTTLSPQSKKSLSPNSKISTRPSPEPWADTPYHLIPTPRDCDRYASAEHYETGQVFVASEMANVHNMILRGLNSIIRQVPYISDATRTDFDEEDVSDLLFYIHAWIRALQKHLDTEETTFYPLVEKAMGVEELMDELSEQHEEFHEHLTKLAAYVIQMRKVPLYYRTAALQALLTKLARPLVHHLYDEIDFILSMSSFDGERLRHCWLEAEKSASSTKAHDQETLYEIFPFVLGNCDRTYEGGNNFPIIPKALRYAIKHWYASKHKGAWRFCSCDFFGRPQPLGMLPENRE